jgi:Ran GTPase-activating protein (RanGAP) involved in mRNA processing and transport
MRALHGNTLLHTLVARQNKMSNATGAAMGTMLLQNRTLRHVSLAWNAIGPNGAEGLAAGLAYSSSLKVLLVLQFCPYHKHLTAEMSMRVVCVLACWILHRVQCEFCDAPPL